jgi:hypothetical protein
LRKEEFKDYADRFNLVSRIGSGMMESLHYALDVDRAVIKNSRIVVWAYGSMDLIQLTDVVRCGSYSPVNTPKDVAWTAAKFVDLVGAVISSFSVFIMPLPHHVDGFVDDQPFTIDPLLLKETNDLLVKLRIDRRLRPANDFLTTPDSFVYSEASCELFLHSLLARFGGDNTNRKRLVPFARDGALSLVYGSTARQPVETIKYDSDKLVRDAAIEVSTQFNVVLPVSPGPLLRRTLVTDGAPPPVDSLFTQELLDTQIQIDPQPPSEPVVTSSPAIPPVTTASNTQVQMPAPMPAQGAVTLPTDQLAMLIAQMQSFSSTLNVLQTKQDQFMSMYPPPTPSPAVPKVPVVQRPFGAHNVPDALRSAVGGRNDQVGAGGSVSGKSTPQLQKKTGYVSGRDDKSSRSSSREEEDKKRKKKLSAGVTDPKKSNYKRHGHDGDRDDDQRGRKRVQTGPLRRH